MSDIGQKIIDKVREIAAAQPEFVYVPPGGPGTTCYYVLDGEGSCIIGRALFALGLIDNSIPFDDNTLTVGALFNTLGIEVDGEEGIWLREVQYQQDSGKPWGEAVGAADRTAVLA